MSVNNPENPKTHILIKGARVHNLKNIDVTIPLKRLVCLTGVSGSGKSTLMRQVLYPALQKHLGEQTEAPGAHDRLEGLAHIDRVVMVDHSLHTRNLCGCL